MQLQTGEIRVIVCGTLGRCGPYKLDDGASGFSAAVDYLGGSCKVTSNAVINEALMPYLGRMVNLIGVPKGGELRIGRLLQAHCDGKQIYSAVEASGPGSDADPAAAAAAKARFAR